MHTHVCVIQKSQDVEIKKKIDTKANYSVFNAFSDNEMYEPLLPVINI